MYSQNNEEAVILDYFGDYVGTFADIGANDGVTLSNTHALVLAGWSGVMVEPSPQAYARLKKNYNGVKGIYTYPFAICNHNGEAVLNESSSLINPDDVALVSTLRPEEMERFKSITRYTPVTVKVFRWKTFLNRLKIKTFDFISIDAEGLDLDILRQIDLSKTRMVCVEWNGKNERAYWDTVNYAGNKDSDGKGFGLIHENGENLIFAR